MCSTAFDKELDINSSYYDVYFYRTNAKDLNNAGDKIPTFNLHDIMGYPSLCYLTTKEYKLQQVKLKQEKAQKQVVFDKTTKAKMQKLQEPY